MPLTDYDLFLFAEGTHDRLYEKLGAHLAERDGVKGVEFAVWAPNAREVSVIGDFNYWSHGANLLYPRGSSGIFDGFVPNIGVGAIYKLAIVSQWNDYRVEKADPYGFAAEMRPRTGSIVWNVDAYQWNDQDWMTKRKTTQAHEAPMSIYEVHLGSWQRVPEDNNRWLSYRELAPRLIEYVKSMGFTHIELLPITEHPFDGSWGYQTVGYFAPTSRFGTPDDFKYFVDTLHQAGIGVILDWVPAHFPHDLHGLSYFDGTHLYEHSDPRQGSQPDWGTMVFNYGRTEVANFLINNALFWLDKYHLDGLRVDAVASMLYLDFSRKEGEWVPNEYGGRENLKAMAFLRRLNERVYGQFPDAVTMAEESTAWPMVSRPTYQGGLGFGFKWDMGWMHDMLDYLQFDPVYRKYHHDRATFRMHYAFNENYVLPLSHDEVVHGKRSLISKMPGDFWQQFANLRLLFGMQWTLPGKKLLFMGGEIAQWHEWNFATSVDWHLLEWDPHKGVQQWVRDLNNAYRNETSLHYFDCEPRGFSWIDCHDSDQSVLTFIRRGWGADDIILVAANFTPVPRNHYRVGVPEGGAWTEMLNSDAPIYGGSGQGNYGESEASGLGWNNQPYSLSITIPPLGMVMFKKKTK